MMRLLATAITIGIFLPALLSCSGGSSPPTIPGPDPVTSAQSKADRSGHVLWGLWECYMEPGGEGIEVVPLRSATFTANVNNLLESTPGNLQITDLDFTDFHSEGLLPCTVTLTHPLPGLDQFHGFDVWGVFLHNGNGSLDYDGLTYPADPDSGDDVAVLLNADGYTRWFNYPEFDGNGMPILEYFPGKLSNLLAPTAALNGYKIFADGLELDDDYYDWISAPTNANDRGIYRAGQVNSRRYELDFPIVDDDPVVEFQYAIIAGWEPGDPTLTGQPNVYDPEDFPASANCDEAFFIHTGTEESTLYNDGTSAGGSFVASIEVFDWQGGAIGGLGVPNEVERIVLEGNFLPGGTMAYTHPELASMAVTGTENSSVFQVEITDCSPLSAGEVEYWVIAESGGMFGASYDQGFATEFPAGAHRAAFLRGTVEVSVTGPMGLTVVSIDPDHAPFWSYVDDAVISGTEFEDGAAVELRKDGQDSVVATEVIWLAETSIQCDFDLAGADSGLWDVVVINPSLEEGILEDGFTISVWSEEIVLDEDGNRLPQMGETSAGSAALLVGCDDNNMRYAEFVEGVGFSAVELAVSGYGGHWLMVLTSDPVNDYVYLCSDLDMYRYSGGTGLWDHWPTPLGWTRATGVAADINGKIHLYHNTSSAFGFIVHNRATAWGGSWEVTYDSLMDGLNINVISEGNIFAQDSSGTIYLVYERDWWLNPYGQQQPGPRWVKVCWIPLGGMLSWNFAVIDTAYDLDPLDSPAITCDADDVLHVAYRRYVPSTDEWEVVYRRSTTSGTSWGSESIINIGEEEPEDGYVFLMVDSSGNLHAVYNLEGEIEYRHSEDGASWSDPESVNPSASGLPPGTEDFTPRMLVTSDGIMHVAGIRGDPASGYGDLYHRMRDLY